MKKVNRVLFALTIITLITATLAIPALAVTAEEVEAHVQEVGREAATGNLFIWFICAIGFLKAAQKIDSFMSSLGISVGHTGGNMLAEAMVAARGIGMAKGAFGSGAGSGFGGGGGGGKAAGGGGGGAHASGGPGSFGGGLSGIIGRRFTNSAVQSVTANQPATPNSAMSVSAQRGATGTAAHPESGAAVGKSGAAVQPGNTHTPPQAATASQGTDNPIPGHQPEGADSQAPGGTMDNVPDGSGFGGADYLDSPGHSFEVGAPDEMDSEAAEPAFSPTSEAVTAPDSPLPGSPQPATAEPYHAPAGGNMARRVFERSLARGGDFATRVTSAVAHGNVANTGTMQGPTASAALSSYLGLGGAGGQAVSQSSGSSPSRGGGVDVSPGMPIAGTGETGFSADAQAPSSDGGAGPMASSPMSEMSHAPIPTFSDVEIGGGRISGVETSPAHPSGIPFAMYSAEQYIKPEGDHETVTAKDGTAWFKQYAEDAVDRKPYKTEDGSIKYHENIVKRMPKMPRRKDKV